MAGLRNFGALVALLLAVLWAIPAGAQWGVRDYPVKAAAAIEPAEARRGAEVTLKITTTITDEAYHFYAMDLRGAEGPIATEFYFAEEGNPFTPAPVGKWKEPEPTVKYDKGFETDIPKHYGTNKTFTRTFRVPVDAEPGDYTLQGHAYIQACTEESCLPPEEMDWSVTLVVLEGEPVAPSPTPEPEPEAQAIGTVAPAGPGEPADGESLAAFMAGAFLFGLLALLTPCVFPMIPITISFFTNKKAASGGHAVTAALVYVLSIILGFTIVGFGISVILYAVGAGVESSGFANMIASDPYINLFFAALYVFFALSLLEVFHMKMPNWLTNRLNKEATGRTDVVGIFFKALVFVFISFTCTAPLLGVLIVQTLTGDWTRPLFGMMAFATGLALPFFVLALVPQLLSGLPRAGSWMYSVKVVMALLVLAASFKFFSNADLVWLKEEMILTREVLLALWATIALVTGLYLFRVFRLPLDEDTNAIGPGRLLTGTTFVALGLYLAGGLFGGRVHTWVEAYLPPDLGGTATMVASGGAGGAAINAARTATGGDYMSVGYSWFTEVEPALEHARATGRNVFIDFTGYSCTNCRLMEKEMFPRPQVADLMSQYVRVKLYTDDRQEGKARRSYQARLFNTVSLPFYAIVTPDQQVIATEAYTTNKEQFVSFLRQGVDGEQVALQ